MKKTIILTLIMFFCSFIADTFVQLSAKENAELKFDSIAFRKNIVNKKNIYDSINLIKPVCSIIENVKIIEKIEINILYKNVKGTVYHAEKNQTDDTPLQTADMSIIDTSKVNDLKWVALSRDLLNRKFTDQYGKKHVWSGKIKLGDTIWIDYDKENLWKITHKNQNKRDSITQKRNDLKYEKLKLRYEKIKGYWIVHDVMGTQYTLKNRRGDYILDKNGKKQIIKITNAIDFLQHPKLGVMDMWDKNIIIAKRNVKYITLNPILTACN